MIVEITTILILLLVLDSIYLYLIFPFLEELSGQKFVINLLPALLIYIILALGIYFFIVREKRSILYAFLLGAFTYSIYELTNYSTLKGWTFKMVLLDSLWGGILFAIVSFLAMRINHYINKFR